MVASSLHFFIIFISLLHLSLGAPGDKSKAKCEEYAKYVYTEEFSPVLSRRAVKDKVSQCGIVEVPLVIGGVAAIPKEFPHMAVIGYGSSPDSEIVWQCGGSLISDSYILTASHCLRNQGGAPQKVRVGEVDFDSTSESDIQDRLISKVIKHPKQNFNEKYDDIALLRMDSPVKFDAFVRPACLHAGNFIKEPTAIATGFGKTSFDATEGSKKLMKVQLSFIKRKQCNDFFKGDIEAGVLSQGITDNMLCAGELQGGKDTCQGDSGGPLQIVLASPYCMYSIVGVVSFGKFCGFANQPAIYTNVTSYISWIESNVWP